MNQKKTFLTIITLLFIVFSSSAVMQAQEFSSDQEGPTTIQFDISTVNQSAYIHEFKANKAALFIGQTLKLDYFVTGSQMKLKFSGKDGIEPKFHSKNWGHEVVFENAGDFTIMLEVDDGYGRFNTHKSVEVTVYKNTLLNRVWIKINYEDPLLGFFSLILFVIFFFGLVPSIIIKDRNAKKDQDRRIGKQSVFLLIVIFILWFLGMVLTAEESPKEYQAMPLPMIDEPVKDSIVIDFKKENMFAFVGESAIVDVFGVNQKPGTSCDTFTESDEQITETRYTKSHKAVMKLLRPGAFTIKQEDRLDNKVIAKRSVRVRVFSNTKFNHVWVWLILGNGAKFIMALMLLVIFFVVYITVRRPRSSN